MPAADLPLVSFPDGAAFEAWLAAQPRDSAGAWLKVAKKGAPKPTVSKTDAIDSLLIHGWIDGQLGAVDEFYFKFRITPRRPKSPWSVINRERVERLLADGRMTPAGVAEVERAQADGRWDRAYPPHSRLEPPEDWLAALETRQAAKVLWAGLDRANRYAVLYRIHQAKPEARKAKIAALADKLERGEVLHPASKPKT